MAARERDAHLRYRVEYDLGRVRGFSDCVFAVAITIVVITFVLSSRNADDASIPWSDIRARRAMGLIPTGGFVLSIPVALVSPTAAQLLWFIPFIGTRAFRIREQRREDKAELS